MEIKHQIEFPAPHPAQQKILDESQRFNAVCCGRRWGKSKMAVRLIGKPAIYGYPTGYFTPTYKLLETTYKECIQTLEPIIQRKHENQFIELHTGGVIDFWTLENQYAGRSRKYKRAVIDEAAFAKNLQDLWNESIRPTLTDLKGDAWFLSTPKGKNDFYKLFMRGKAGEANWASWQMSTFTNPHIDPLEIEDAKRDLPALAFSQEYMAEFNENVANPFGYDFIKICAAGMSNRPAVCYGIDLAKSFDWSVIIGLDQFGQVCHFERFQKPWMDTVNHIKTLPDKPMLIDSTGVGDPIVEQVQQGRNQVVGRKFTSQSKQQLMEGLAVSIQQRKVLYPEGPIKDELENFEYEFTKTGVKYSAPEGLHDDCVCALALAVDMHKTAVRSGSYSWA